MKKALLTLAMVAGLAAAAQAQLLITGMVDGTLTGGNPKGMEIYATQDIADLSLYYIARDTNGAGPWDTFLQLPEISLSKGDFFYVAGNSDTATTLNGFGFTVGLTNSILSINGDDIIGLATSNTPESVFDSFGVVAQGDTNFYENSFAVRLNTSIAPSLTSTDASNFTITAYSDAGLQGAGGFGTFAPVPEPSTYALAMAGLLLTVVVMRRRSRRA